MKTVKRNSHYPTITLRKNARYILRDSSRIYRFFFLELLQKENACRNCSNDSSRTFFLISPGPILGFFSGILQRIFHGIISEVSQETLNGFFQEIVRSFVQKMLEIFFKESFKYFSWDFFKNSFKGLFQNSEFFQKIFHTRKSNSVILKLFLGILSDIP